MGILARICNRRNQENTRRFAKRQLTGLFKEIKTQNGSI
jgi:tRNA A37 N6-isopentenylltransferase MiaA